MWKYMILYNSDQGPDYKAVECEYIAERTREEAANKLCEKYGIPQSKLIAVLEISPSVKVTVANDGSMIRFRA
jgi:predicted short-subunit dehydrogenase-like oxidoreductase (DUF2520 family)